MTVASVIDNHITGTYTVTRVSSAITFTMGRADARVETTFTVDAHIQPAKGEDLAILPEGKTLADSLWFWTRTELRAGGEGNEPDRITIDGKLYAVSSLANWSAEGPYYKVLLVRV